MDFIVEESRYALAGLPAFIVGLNIKLQAVENLRPQDPYQLTCAWFRVSTESRYETPFL